MAKISRVIAWAKGYRRTEMGIKYIILPNTCIQYEYRIHTCIFPLHDNDLICFYSYCFRCYFCCGIFFLLFFYIQKLWNTLFWLVYFEMSWHFLCKQLRFVAFSSGVKSCSPIEKCWMINFEWTDVWLRLDMLELAHYYIHGSVFNLLLSALIWRLVKLSC